MKVIPYISFWLAFKHINNQTRCYSRLKKFLHETDWLPDVSDHDANLLSYRTDEDGVCEVIIYEQSSVSLKELSEIFFRDAISKLSDLAWVITIWDENTDKIVLTRMDFSTQLKDIQDISQGDKIVIFGQV